MVLLWLLEGSPAHVTAWLIALVVCALIDLLDHKRVT